MKLKILKLTKSKGKNIFELQLDKIKFLKQKMEVQKRCSCLTNQNERF